MSFRTGVTSRAIWRSKRFVSEYIRHVLSSVILVVLPVPIGPFRRLLVGHVNEKGTLEFYSHPRIICAVHLVWLGWVVAACGLYNTLAAQFDAHTLPMELLTWAWVVVLIVTMLSLGMEFDRYACSILGLAVAVISLAVLLVESRIDVPLTGSLFAWLRSIPVGVDWGIPATISFVLGLVLAGTTAWQRMNDRWMVTAFGNKIDHMNFLQTEQSIPQAAKAFAAVHHCMLRRFLLFGYGDIEIRSAAKNQAMYKICGVFFATWHAEQLKHRLRAVDTRTEAVIAEEEEAEEEAAADAEF